MVHYLSTMLLLSGICLLLFVDAAKQRDRCFLNKVAVPHQLPELCGCTGFSPSLKRRFNVILPPHAGTGTLTMMLDEIVNIKSCVHEHTDLAVHQQELSGLHDYCERHQSTGSISVSVPALSPVEYGAELCGTQEDPEFLVAIARNPYSRLVTGFHFVGEEQHKGYDKLNRDGQIKAFRQFVRYGASHYIKPLSKMLRGEDGVLIYPDFVVNNVTPGQYLDDLLNLLRVLGFGNNSTIESIRASLGSGHGHHISHPNSLLVPLIELFDDETAAMTVSRYRDDFEIFNFERNYTKV